MLAALILGLRVKLRRTQYEQMFSASPLRTDIPACPFRANGGSGPITQALYKLASQQIQDH
jgi:hypothetical protein